MARTCKGLAITALYAALSRTNQLIVREHDVKTLHESSCRICVDTGHARVACVLLREGDSCEVFASAGPVDEVLKGDLGIRAMAAFPIRRAAQVVGTLCLYVDDARFFDAQIVAAGISPTLWSEVT